MLGSLFSVRRDCTRLAVPVLQNTACRMFYRHRQGVRGGEASCQKHRTGNLHRHRKRMRPSSCSTRSSDAIMVLNKRWFRERPARTGRTALCKQKARETQTEASPRCQKVSPFSPITLYLCGKAGGEMNERFQRCSVVQTMQTRAALTV